MQVLNGPGLTRCGHMATSRSGVFLRWSYRSYCSCVLDVEHASSNFTRTSTFPGFWYHTKLFDKSYAVENGHVQIIAYGEFGLNLKPNVTL